MNQMLQKWEAIFWLHSYHLWKNSEGQGQEREKENRNSSSVSSVLILTHARAHKPTDDFLSSLHHGGCCKQGIKGQHSTYYTLQNEITIKSMMPLAKNDYQKSLYHPFSLWYKEVLPTRDLKTTRVRFCLFWVFFRQDRHLSMCHICNLTMQTSFQ